MNRRALIVGLAGPELTSEERAFLAAERPAGIILFARNCVALDQIRALAAAAVAAIGSGDTLVLIDQEGGRVRRLRPPMWRDLPAADAYARLYLRDPARAVEVARLAAHLTAQELRAIGINTSCAPVLDLRIPGAHDIIGDRAYGATPDQVSALGRAVCEGLMAGGVVPVIKHIPGHGRAHADSHFELPVVDTSRAELDASDFEPFRRLAHAPSAMTAHVVYTAVDPVRAASVSPVAHRLIRETLGYDGLLMSDDIGMKALAGDFAARAAAVIAAGSDVVLHCSGNLDEMRAAASVCPVLAGHPMRRFARAIDVTRAPSRVDIQTAEAALTDVLSIA